MLDAADRACLATPSPARGALMRRLAMTGAAAAQALYGQMLLDGVEVARDARAALGWFTRAAAQHHLDAINMVGRCYDLGWGTPIDKARAAACFRVASDRGLAWGRYNYATALALGQGVVSDRPAALALFEAVAAGDGLVAAKAANFVGSFAEDGWAGPVDLDRAAGCYARAAGGGDFRGAFNHARMLWRAGEADAAIAWIARAAALGHARFRGQVAAWLDRQPAAVRDAGLAALERGVRC